MSKTSKKRPLVISITLGDICISDGIMPWDTDPDTIWLAHRDGEAGSFSRKKLAKVLEKFFDKHF
jgi:hypothetical protein